MQDSVIIKGEYITIEELPIGCVITDKVNGNSVIIGSKADASVVIDSLQRLKKDWYNE